jgi:hypothetical protein
LLSSQAQNKSLVIRLLGNHELDSIGLSKKNKMGYSKYKSPASKSVMFNGIDILQKNHILKKRGRFESLLLRAIQWLLFKLGRGFSCMAVLKREFVDQYFEKAGILESDPSQEPFETFFDAYNRILHLYLSGETLVQTDETLSTFFFGKKIQNAMGA